MRKRKPFIKAIVFILLWSILFAMQGQQVGCEDSRLDVSNLGIYEKNRPLHKMVMTDSMKVISFYFVTDNYTRDAFGSDAPTIQWLKDNYEVMAGHLKKNGISTTLSGWEIADVAGGLMNEFDVLNAFGSYCKNIKPGREKVFITAKGAQRGVAWIGTFDNDYFYYATNDWHVGPYAVLMGALYNHNSFWNSYGIVHEVGHNLGSHHTHDCEWGSGNNKAIDNCYGSQACGLVSSPTPNNDLGTIMSYCHLSGVGVQLEKGFGPTVLSRINNLINQAGRDLTGGYQAIRAHLTGNVNYHIEASEYIQYYNAELNNSEARIE